MGVIIWLVTLADVMHTDGR